MTDLKCSVYDCAHHSAGCCCKPDIRVDGTNATNCGDTCCASYAPRGTQNDVSYTEPNERLEISCTAGECMYNKNTRCSANNVSINTIDGNAGCSTFIKR